MSTSVVSPVSDARRSGIAPIGEVFWGAHLCQFFQTSDDLIDVLVPFFKAGLEDGEQCLWITAAPLRAANALDALRRAVPDLSSYLERGQLQVLDHEDWYGRGLAIGSDLLADWLAREEAARRQGYRGLRVSGNTSWLERKDWEAFVEYERRVHAAFAERRILALCSYSIDRLSSSELLDVLRNHGFVLVRHERGWNVIRSATALLAEVDQLRVGEPPTQPARRPNLELVRPPKVAAVDGHNVRFYDEMRFPADGVAAYVASGLRAGDGVVVLSTKKHFQAIQASLEKASVDVAAALRRGQLVSLDAEATLDALHVEGEIHHGQFELHIGSRIRQLFTRFQSVRAFGELVDVFCRRGRVADAIRLEGWWNGLRQERPFGLLCAYGFMSFSSAADRGSFAGVCAEHSDVHAGEPDTESSSFDRGRLAAHLAQRTRALEEELARARQLEAERERLVAAERQAASDAAKMGRHLGCLQRLTSALSEAATRADVVRVLQTEMARTVGALTGRLAVPVDGGRRFAYLGYDGEPATERGPTFVEPPPSIATAYHAGTPVWLSPSAAPDSAPQLVSRGDPVEAMVALPLTTGTQRLGVVAFGFARQHTIAPVDRALLEDVACQLALALDRANHYDAANLARMRAEDALRAKDEFLAMLGHELRNPLSPMLTAVRLMRLRAGDVAVKERAVIERQLDHMIRLVDDLLDVSRITRGALELSRRPIELAEVVAQAIEIVSPMLEGRAHRLSIDVAEQGLLVDADLHRLAQVVANLLTNAAKFTANGGSIEVRAERKGERLRLSVRDNGIGIEPSLLPRVFDSFVQGRQASDRAIGGLGLGLAIVRCIVELHDGSVAVFSEGQGSGSTFVVELPMATRGMAVGASEPPEPRPADGYRSTQGAEPPRRRILVVDDNPDAAEILAESLEAVGYAARVAHDGPGALALLDGFLPELALLDIGLPVMDGYELARHLKERFGDTCPVLVAVTGYGQPDDRKRAIDAGFDAHVVKPVDFDRLEPILRKLLQGAGSPAA